jgi:hypothetical protein
VALSHVAIHYWETHGRYVLMPCSLYSTAPVDHRSLIDLTTLWGAMSDKASKPQREPSKSTLRRHRNGKSSQAEKAAKQQYLTPREEKAPR